jgi:peptidoglycan glycosyltransferase
VATLEDAVAVSCNIAFGRLALLVGQDALDAELRRYGFDPDTDPIGVIGADFSFAMGRLLTRDTAHPAYALARRGIGLDSITITPVQAAVLAAGLARGGVPPSLHAIEEKRNILDEVSYRAETGLSATDALPIDKAAVIARAMQAAVTSSSGTARRASLAGLSTAMKTGTSGKNPPGYDALVIGFAPAEKPVIAWAVVAQGAGKAEWEGARITRAFLEKAKPALAARP